MSKLLINDNTSSKSSTCSSIDTLPLFYFNYLLYANSDDQKLKDTNDLRACSR